jgi:hypothetical protein
MFITPSHTEFVWALEEPPRTPGRSAHIPDLEKAFIFHCSREAHGSVWLVLQRRGEFTRVPRRMSGRQPADSAGT